MKKQIFLKLHGTSESSFAKSSKILRILCFWKCHFECGPKALDVRKKGYFGNFVFFVRNGGQFLRKMTFLELKKAIFERLVKGPLLDTLTRSEKPTFWSDLIVLEGSGRLFEKMRWDEKRCFWNFQVPRILRPIIFFWGVWYWPLVLVLEKRCKTGFEKRTSVDLQKVIKRSYFLSTSQGHFQIGFGGPGTRFGVSFFGFFQFFRGLDFVTFLKVVEKRSKMSFLGLKKVGGMQPVK